MVLYGLCVVVGAMRSGNGCGNGVGRLFGAIGVIFVDFVLPLRYHVSSQCPYAYTTQRNIVWHSTRNATPHYSTRLTAFQH